MDAFLKIAKALSDPTRLRALLALRRGELCLCQLIALLDLAPSTISKHMSLLLSSGLVRQRKEGRWRYFSLPDSPPEPVRGALDWAFRVLDGTAQADRDAKKVEEIHKKDRTILCRRYFR